MKNSPFTLNQLGLAAMALLGFMLPFELEMAGVRVGPIVLTNVEIFLELVILLAFLLWLQQGRPSLGIPASWVWLAVLFIGGLILSSLLAPEFGGNAIKAALRTINGILLALAVLQVVKSRRDLYWVAGALVSGGLVAIGIGLWESWYGDDFAWLTLFRNAPTMAGPFLRLAGPFDYANQAAMFIEATLPLLLVFTWLAYRKGKRVVTAVLVLVVVLYLEAGILTLSRSNFATILLVSLALAAFFWLATSPPQKQRAYAWLAVAGTMLVLLLLNTLGSSSFQLRLNTEGDNEWYQANLQVPAQLSIQAQETISVPVTLTNEGALTWQVSGKNPISLVARWIQTSTGLERTEPFRWALHQEVNPGETVTLTVPVEAPKKGGDYKLVWDLDQKDVVRFEAKSGITASSQVTVIAEGDQVTDDETWTEATSYASPIPGRRTLWAVALQKFRRHPVWGIGLDNFRLTYGRELGYEKWNESVHTNSWYLEMLVSLGLAGSLPFFAWLTLLAIDMAQTLRRTTTTLWQVGIVAGLLAYLIHGLLDYFLLFNSTGLLFWLLIGLWLSQKQISRSRHAYPYRV
jgi:hypothetical protein